MAESRLPIMICPHCEAKAITRNGNTVTPLYRELRYKCTNDECGHIFLASLSIVHSVVPSAMPRKGINLKISPAFLARLAVNDIAPFAANDGGPPTKVDRAPLRPAR